MPELLRDRARPPGDQRLRDLRRDRRPPGLRRRPARGLPLLRLRLEDDHPGAARRQRAAADLGDAGRDDQLDRPAEQGPGRVPGRGPAAAGRAAGAADRLGDGDRPGGVRRGWSRRVGERDEVAAIELNVSCPNVHSGLIVGEQPTETEALLEALRPLTDEAADREADAERRRPGRGRGRRRGGRGRRGLADQHPEGGGGRSGDRRARRSPPATAASRGRRCARSRCSSCAPSPPPSGCRSIGMGGSPAAPTRPNSSPSGPRLVAVGTENFRDPRAGSRVAAELGRRPRRARRGHRALDLD